ncbi:hypothetical protein AB5I41_22890 [Sphingomonas sp. MMS24-JH45]
MIDAEGFVTRSNHDAGGRLVATLRFAVPVQATDATTPAQLEAAGGSYVATTFAYDALDRLVGMTDANGVTHGYTYAANGLVEFDTRAAGTADESRTRFEYDAAGRRTAVFTAWGKAEQAVTRYSLNAFGEVLRETDALGRVTTYIYDRTGQRTHRTDAAGGVTSWGYDAFGQQVRETDARGNASFSYYDDGGRLFATRDAESYVTHFAYNPFGEVASSVRRANRATNDAFPTVVPAVAASTSDATTTFAYDKLGRLIATTDAEGFTETTSYDASAWATRVQNRIGGLVDYGYDRRGLLVREYVHAPVHDATGAQVAPGYVRHAYAVHHARANRVQDVEAQGLAEQRTTVFVYDAADRLIAKRGDAVAVGLPGAATTVTPTESYTRDARGNVTQVIDAAGARTLKDYDRLDRVVAEVRTRGDIGGSTATLTQRRWDANGNLLAELTYDAAVTMPAAGAAAPAAPAGGYREILYGYDALDRRTSTSRANVRTCANGTQYTTTIGTVTSTTTYDADGNVVREVDANGNATIHYYDRAGRRIARVDAENHLTAWTLDADGNVVLERRSAARLATVDPAVMPAPATNDAADRVTDFGYDRNGRRLTESRRNVASWSVDPATGALAAATGSATVSYAYNGLGEVVRKTEATGDFTDYTYDTTGRLTLEARAAFVDQAGATVRPTVDYCYNGLGDLVRSVESGARITGYNFGAGGRLLSSVDAAGNGRSYHYDALWGGRSGEVYARQDSAGVLRREGLEYRYDAEGALVYQGHATADGNWAATGDAIRFAYNAHGETVSRSVNGVVQETFAYDNAGRLWRSNADDGATRHYIYDANGNQTIMFESSGADIRAASLDTVIQLSTDNGAPRRSAVVEPTPSWRRSTSTTAVTCWRSAACPIASSRRSQRRPIRRSPPPTTLSARRRPKPTRSASRRCRITMRSAA